MPHTRFTREVHAYGALHLPKREEKITVLQSNSVYVLHRPFFQSYLLYLRFFFLTNLITWFLLVMGSPARNFIFLENIHRSPKRKSVEVLGIKFK